MVPLTPDRWRQVQEILEGFDELTAADRPAFLASTCGDDAQLRSCVEALTAHDDKIDGFLERPLFSLSSENLDDGLLVPRIGPFQLVRELGEGGMGTVYLAVQQQPFHRQVALKLVRPEILTPDTVRRFAEERQILAGIRHPNVAHLYEGGTTPDGRPYFAMEYVEGEPIQDYCDHRQLTVDERLGLFLQVCSAVGLAHQKLRIIHRDLKPGNILVTDDGTPKLLDFGIAQPLDAQPYAGGGATSVWTPGYSSPEQLGGERLSTASDIYSLGVLLYRLLTGRLPYRIETAEPEALRQAIRAQPPERPSAVVLRQEEQEEPCEDAAPPLTPAAVGRLRGVSPGRLRRRLAGDLDAIVLKALECDPAERYSSVEQLAEDLRRHQAWLPVIARAPTPLYRLGKFAGRYRHLVAVVALVAALGTSLILTQAREIAQVRRVSSSLVELMKALQPATPDQRVEIEAALEKAGHIVDDPMFAGDALNRAVLMDALGRAYTSLGRYRRAEDLLTGALEIRRRNLGGDHVLVADSLHNLAFLYQHMGQAGRAETHLRQSLQIRYKSSDPDPTELSHGINSLAIVLYDGGYYAEAEALFRRILPMRRRQLGDEHPDVIRARNNLASALVQQGAYREAEAVYRENLEVRLKLFGADHKDVATSRNQLATVLYALDDLETAESEVREALRIRREVYAPEHRNVGLVWNNLGMVLQGQGLHGEAEAAYRRALAILRAQLGDDHLYVAVTRRNLASVLEVRGDPVAAERLAAQALEVLRTAVASTSWRIADAESVYGGCLAAQGRFDEAEPLLLRSFEVIRQARGAGAPYTREAAQRLVELYEASGKPESAALYRRSSRRGE